MTDKQIIIDGIDVSKCNYFNNTDKSYCEECCSEFGCAICNDRPNCYYKQLARKEQECESWKKVNDEKNEFLKKLGISATGEFHRIKYYIDKQAKELEQLKSENEILKEKLVISSNSDKKTLKIIQTLAEIKEIAESKSLYGATCQDMKQILQKISEVENEN